MYLFLDWIECSNFMGGTFRYEFTQRTNIFGDNGVGKTRIKDAYLWLITGYNSANTAKFHIKDTIDRSKNKLPSEVSAGFRLQDGTVKTFSKAYVEKWDSIQGSEEEVLKTHEINYKIDGNKKTKTQYVELLTALIPPNLLKILSDPLYFSEQKSWEEQRDILELMASEVTNEYVLNRISTPEKDFAAITNLLNRKETLQERKSRLSYEIAELRKAKNPIKSKIEENTLHITNLGEINVVKINTEIERLTGEIAKIDLAINNKTEAENKQSEDSRGKRSSLNALKNSQQEIEHKTTQEYNTEKSKIGAGKTELEDKITGLNVEITSKKSLITSLDTKAGTLEADRIRIEKEWQTVNAEDFPKWDENNFVCKTCNRKHETDNVQAKTAELEQHFIKSKKERLENLNAEWTRTDKQKTDNLETKTLVSSALVKLQESLTETQTKLDELIKKIANSEEVKTVATRLNENTEYQQNIFKINNFTKELEEVKPIDYGELRNEKNALVKLVDDQKLELQKVDRIKEYQTRNTQLAAEEKTLAGQIAGYEREELLIDEFIISKSNFIEQMVRDNFKHVTFKMFKTTLADPTPKPACEIWYQEKPFAALNYAAKINAGLDIINGLSNHYSLFLPILIDNKESIVRLPEMKSQIITFTVSEKDKSLRVENIL